MQVDSGIQEDQPGDATGRVVRCANPTPLLTNLSQTPKPLLHLFLQLRHLFRQENKFFNLMGKKKSEAECCTCSSSYPPASDVWGSLRDGKSTYSLLRSTYSSQECHIREVIPGVKKGAITKQLSLYLSSCLLSPSISLPPPKNATCLT